MPGSPPTHAEAETKRRIVWDLSNAGLNMREVAAQAGMDRGTVRLLLTEMRADLRAARLERGYDDLATALSEQDEVIEECDRRLDQMAVSKDSLTVPQLLTTKSQASERKARLLGLITDKRRLDVAGETPIEVTISFDRASAADTRRPVALTDSAQNPRLLDGEAI